jgi:chromosome segregation ATPase
MPLPNIMPIIPGRSNSSGATPSSSGGGVAVKKKTNAMLENASAEELSVLVLTIQEEYAKLSKDKASADSTISNLNQQYKDAMDEICSLSSRMQDLEAENEEVRSMMETQSVEFEKSASEIASIESLKKASDHALREREAQTTAMREALVGEIARLTAANSKYANEVEELREEKEDVESENKKLHEELILARREIERARIEGTMSTEETTKRLRDTETKLESELENLQHKFEIERNVVDAQKTQIDHLESELDSQLADSEAAARSYEAAISELKSRLEALQSDHEEKEELANRTDQAERTIRQLDDKLQEVNNHDSFFADLQVLGC